MRKNTNGFINKFIEGKCEEVLTAFPDNSIDFILTSPPYADQRVYGTNEFTISPDDYVEWFIPKAREIYRVLSNNGSFVLNINDKVVNGVQQLYVYELVIRLCKEVYLVVKGLLQSKSDGSVKMMDFLDEQRMCRLYERFILEYYRKEHPEIRASASQIPWQLDDDFSFMLPVMQTDIMLSKGNTTLIIDAKYYGHTTQEQYGVHTLHSGNLYQIFTYVKNKDAEYGEQPHNVSGMLLYAQTDESVQPNNVYHMGGNKISVRTLNLNCSFNEIASQLDGIVAEHFA